AWRHTMSSRLRRYVFIDFDGLKKVKFKKLEKVCDKLFVLINIHEENIPFQLVMNMQKLGRGVKWVVVNSPKEVNLNYHLAFLMGKLHQKISKEIEFAVLSNDKTFDPLIAYINENGRSCLRVKRKKEKAIKHQATNGKTVDTSALKGNKTDEEQLPFIITEATNEGDMIDETANETIERLKYSGNRPSEVILLRDYILLHHQEATQNGNADRIIDRLIETHKIEVEKGVVKYNF
ncbi:MAG: PIN domain-containing protein, partial [Bacteroidota bacterium]